MADAADSTDAILQQQIAYYQARAGEYDEWFLRQGRYDHGPALNEQWFAEVEEVVRALEAFGPRGRVLELACGTGLWTERLARYTDTLTALDSSSAVLALNRARVNDPRVRYIETDLFSWQPDGEYDTVFFSFWLSHVPPERFAPFWEMVRASLTPDGRVFLIDSLFEQTSTARDHQLNGPEATTVTRSLNDGQQYEIVKVFYTPETLTAKLAPLGWQMDMHATEHYFLYGSGEPMR
jgi:demethylmenaquinone methyltransferase/2-methoxy-6-polyprenyl-1,4-benzoquinol methylase